MAIHLKRKKAFLRAPPGSSPGTFKSSDDAQETLVEILAYSNSALAEKKDPSLKEIESSISQNNVTWIRIAGHKDVKKISEIASLLGVHSLTLEDVFHVHQRAKFENFEKYNFLVINYLLPGDLFTKKQTSFIMGEKFVLSIHETDSNVLDPVKDRLRKGFGNLRQRDSEYLIYALVDAYIDYFFPVAEAAHAIIDELENQMIKNDSIDEVFVIHDLKVKLNQLYQIVWNHKEVFGQLCREADSPFSAEIRVYLRDCLDHTMQLLDYIEMLRGMVSGLMDLQIALQNTRANEVMKFLTVVTSIFIPLSFVTGLYGMNFNADASPYNMPELSLRYGYVAVLTFMVIAVAIMLYYFTRKKWILVKPKKIRRHP